MSEAVKPALAAANGPQAPIRIPVPSVAVAPQPAARRRMGRHRQTLAVARV